MAAGGGSAARADDAVACARSAESAQALRSAAKVVRARQALLVCVRDVCPRIVRQDCLRWLAEVDAALPSVVFRARGSDGSDVTAVQVYLDGQKVAERLTGISIPVDPGAHTLRFVDASDVQVVLQVLVAEGEQHRVFSVTMPESRGARSSLAPAEPATRPVPALTWALGGLAVAGGAAFGILVRTGASDFDRLEDSCGRTRSCTDGQVAGARAQYVAADIALGVGIAALGGAAWSFLERPAASPAAGLSLTPLGGGALAGWRGIF